MWPTCIDDWGFIEERRTSKRAKHIWNVPDAKSFWTQQPVLGLLAYRGQRRCLVLEELSWRHPVKLRGCLRNLKGVAKGSGPMDKDHRTRKRFKKRFCRGAKSRGLFMGILNSWFRWARSSSFQRSPTYYSLYLFFWIDSKFQVPRTAALNHKRLGVYQRLWKKERIESIIFRRCELVTEVHWLWFGSILNPKRLGIYQRQCNLGIEPSIFGSCALVTDQPFDQSLWDILNGKFIDCGLAQP